MALVRHLTSVTAFLLLATAYILTSVLVKAENIQTMCRTRGALLPPKLFAMHTCALCYAFMLPSAFVEKAVPMRIHHADGDVILQLMVNNITVAADAQDPYFGLLSATFRNEDGRQKWHACCDEAIICCQDMLANNVTAAEGWCPRTWDGWLCWQDAPPHSTQYSACPAYIAVGSDPPSCMFASKQCEAEGKWFHFMSGEEWTNYSTCSLVNKLKNRAYVSIAAYSVTIVAIVPALLIFSIYRQLRVARVALHRQLFASLLLNAAAVIAFKSLVLLPQTQQSPLIDQSSVTCKILLLATKYLRVTNYMWMFCEGFYLHRLISTAFVEHNSLLLFYLIGWGFPLLPLLIFVVVRIIEDSAENNGTVQCWAFQEGLSEWVFYVPCLLSLALNLVFLTDIIRVLWLKLRARHQDEPSQYRKTVRATLVLVPLFGLHLSLTMYRPASGSCSGAFIQWYYMVDYILDGLQGFLVALTFCYCNGEVHYLMHRSYQRFMLRHRPGMMLQSWVSTVAPHGASHTTLSLADAPNHRSRGTSSCCSNTEVKDDTPPPAVSTINGETGM